MVGNVGNSDPVLPPPLDAHIRQGWRAIAHYRFEIALCLLLLATLAAVRFQDAILSRTIVIVPHDTAIYPPHFYGDAIEGGSSTIDVDPATPMAWQCTLRLRYAYPYCGYELLLDRRTPNKGFDLSKFDTVTLDLDYRGPFDAFRMYIKNFDPRYSTPGKPDTLKFNKVEIAAQRGHNVIALKLANFGVAEWWVTENKIRPALSTTQFNDVTQFEFQTGSLAPPGTYSFQVHSITLHGRFISRATWYALILAAWVGLVTLYLIVRIFKLRQDLERRGQSQAAALRVAEYAEESARRDYLTRLLNRHGVIDLYHRMAMDRRREGTFAAILIDVDHFKQVNDCFGHAIGDQVLAGIANILSANMRSSDIVGRWGGEEFLLICNVGDHNAAFAIATKLREAIEANEFPMAGRVTASFGVYCGSGRMDALDQVTSCADAALYVAKEQGRNRVVMYKPSMRAAA